MTKTNHSFSPMSYARVAGLLYLVIIVCGVGGEGLIRAPLTGKTAAETVANLLNAELAFRLSIVADVAMMLADVALGVLLYLLFAPVSKTLSMLAMAFRLAQAAVLGMNLVNLHRAVTLAHSTGLGEAQRDVLVTSALNAHAAGYDMGLMFFAVNCLLVGVLVIRSGFLPKWIGAGIALSGLVYFIGSTLRFVAPSVATLFAPAYGIPLLAELAFCGWLMFKGLDVSVWSTWSQADQPEAEGPSSVA